MADVFISYTKRDRNITTALAADIAANGYSVWWDTELLPGDKFRRRIDEELALAKAVVIIWTLSSINSDWVISEAQDAYASDKLISTIGEPGLHSHQIPKPFGVLHHVPVLDRAAIMEAIRGKAKPQSKGRKSAELRIFRNEDERFLHDACEEIRKRAQLLQGLTETQEWSDEAEHARQLVTAGEMLEESLKVLLSALPLPGLDSFHLRLWVKRLEDAGWAAMQLIAKEIRWLETKRTRAVIVGAHNDLGYACRRLLEAMAPSGEAVG